jgi:hypothetical protein
MKHFTTTLLLAALFTLSCAPRDDVPEGPSANPGEPVQPTPPPIPDSILPRINAALKNVESRDLRTTNGFWTVFHGILGLGPDVMLLDDETGNRVKALDLICTGKGLRGLSLVPTPDGLDVETQPGTGVGQGHQDQFVAEMVEWGVPASRTLTVGERTYTFQDFFHQSLVRASTTKPYLNNPSQELSWAIIIIGQQYGTKHTWRNVHGETLTYEDVVRYELNQPIDNAACGGTHRLYGLTWAYHLHRAAGGEATGVWKDVYDKTELYKRNARKFQNSDGSFSTAYVSKAENKREFAARIAGTGHTLEWLALALTDDELREQWMKDAASALSVMILENQNNPIDGGALYHAVHGLYTYRARAFNVPGPPGLHMPVVPK